MARGRLFDLFLLPLLLCLLSSCSVPGREAALLLGDIAAGAGPSRLKAETGTPEIQEVRFSLEGRSGFGDLYRPAGPALGGIVLVHGIAEAGKDDPRLVQFASSLARARFLVFVPDLSGLRNLRVQQEDVTAIEDAFVYLLSLDGDGPCVAAHAGLVAFSYAVGPTILAAMGQRARDKVRFILGVGGYYDLAHTVGFFTTGYFRDDGTWRYLKPNDYAKWIFVLSNVPLLSHEGDRGRFERMARRRMAEPGAPVTDLAEGLTQEGLALYALLENEDPERTESLIRDLPPRLAGLLSSMTLAGKDMRRLTADMILVHGRRDDVIPYTQSLALAEAARPGQAGVYLLDGLFHVDARFTLGDRFVLWQAIDRLLDHRCAR